MSKYMLLYFILAVASFLFLLTAYHIEPEKNQLLCVKKYYAKEYENLSRGFWEHLSEEQRLTPRTAGFLLLVGTILAGFGTLGYGIWRMVKKNYLLEPVTEPDVPWGAGSFLRLLILFAFSVTSVQFVLSAVVTHLTEGHLSVTLGVAADIVSKLALFGLALFLFIKEFSADRRSLGFTYYRETLTYPFFVLLLSLPLIHIGSLFWNIIIEKMGYRIEGNLTFYIFLAIADGRLPTHIFLLVIPLAVVVAPITEEFIFRSLLFASLRKRTGFISAMVLTSLIFALLHPQLASFVPIFILSMFLCYLYERTSSLLSTAIMHSVYNGFHISIFLLMFYRW